MDSDWEAAADEAAEVRRVKRTAQQHASAIEAWAATVGSSWGTALHWQRQPNGRRKLTTIGVPVSKRTSVAVEHYSDRMIPEEQFLAMTPDDVFAECEVEYAAAVSRLQADDVVLDVGANVGGFAALCTAAARVICIEPLPENCLQLQRLPHVELWQGALCADGSPSSVLLDVPTNRGAYARSTSASMIQFGGRDTQQDRAVAAETLAVPTIPVSALAALNATVLKIDVEGAEAFLPVEDMLGGVRLLAMELHGFDEFTTQRSIEIAEHVERHFQVVSGSTQLSAQFPKTAVFVAVRKEQP